MSAIEKIQIRGIRAFSPNDDQTIEFYSPLTMIVGANGCGKTTIIECLNYACSGVLPPSSGSGKAFVNDPLMTDSTEVKAHVKLRFRNRAGFPTVVIRSFQLTKKKNKLEFKTLDGVIRTTDENGNKVSISHKCAELDREVPDLLGVSPAILENVIFCHQEESAWPLQESAILKKKFDDIFESTRYSKALEAIVKTKKDFTAKTKEMKVEVAELGAHLKNAKDTRKALQEIEDKRDGCMQEIDNVKEQIDRAEEKYYKLDESFKKSRDAMEECNRMQNDLNRLSDRVRDREQSLKHIFNDPDEELKNLLKNYDNTLQAKTNELKAVQRKVSDITNRTASNRKQLNLLSTRKGEGFTMNQVLTSNITKLNDFVSKVLTREYGMSVGTQRNNNTFDERLMTSFVEQTVAKVAEIEKDSSSRINSARIKERESYAEQMACNTNLQQILSDIKNIENSLKVNNENKINVKKEIDAYMRECNATGNYVSSSSNSGGYNNVKNEVENDYNISKKRLSDFMSSYSARLSEITENKKTNEEKLRILNDEYRKDSLILNDLSYHRSEFEKIDAQEKMTSMEVNGCNLECISLLNEFHSVLNENNGLDLSANSAVDLLCVCPPNLQSPKQIDLTLATLRTRLSQQQEQRVICKEKIDGFVKKIGATNGSLDQLQKRKIFLSKYLDELQGFDAEIRKQIQLLSDLRIEIGLNDDADDFNTIMSLMRKGSTTFSSTSSSSSYSTSSYDGLFMHMNLDKLIQVSVNTDANCVETLFAHESSSIWKAKFLKKSKGGKSAAAASKCPCCDRGLNASEYDIFEAKLNEMFKSTKEDERVAKEARMKAKDINSNIVNICSNVRSAVEYVNEYNNVTSEISLLENKLNDLTNSEKSETKKYNQCNLFIGHCENALLKLTYVYNKWDDAIKKHADITTKRQQINPYSNSIMMGQDDGRGIGDIEETQRAREREKDLLIRNKDHYIEEENILNSKMNTLRDAENKNHIRLITIQQSEEKFRQLQLKADEYDKVHSSNIESRNSKNSEKNTIEYQLREKENNYELCRKVLKSIEDECLSNTNKIKNELSSLKSLIKDAKDVHAKYMELNMESITTQITGIENENNKLNIECNGMLESIKQMEEQITLHESNKVVISDNLLLRELKQNENTLRNELQLKRRDLGRNEKAVQDERREMDRLQQEITKYGKENAELKGRKDVLTEQISEYQKKLKGDTLRNIDERFRKKNIELETTNLAVNDLECYYNALDSALQKFHMLRINEINKILKELWSLVYQGRDIESIELVSGSDESSGAVGRATKSYNYRVVMCKGDAQLDMRGRCSAGQRVLASIVIRLALAETFCLKCGILALDEPTTNLDEPNKLGLARALARIIASRKSQNNFQFVCITHDEDFVEMMKKELSAISSFSMPENYFRIVRREQEGNPGKFFSHIECCSFSDT